MQAFDAEAFLDELECQLQAIDSQQPKVPEVERGSYSGSFEEFKILVITLVKSCYNWRIVCSAEAWTIAERIFSMQTQTIWDHYLAFQQNPELQVTQIENELCSAISEREVQSKKMTIVDSTLSGLSWAQKYELALAYQRRHLNQTVETHSTIQLTLLLDKMVYFYVRF